MVWLTGENLAKMQEPEPKTELREGYGLLYQYLGGLYHGLNKYWLIIGFKIPKLYYRSHLDLINPEFCKEATNLARGTHLIGWSCQETWNVVMRNKERTELLQQELDHLIGYELPAVIPGFNPGDVGMDLGTEAFKDRNKDHCEVCKEKVKRTNITNLDPEKVMQWERRFVQFTAHLSLIEQNEQGINSPWPYQKVIEPEPVGPVPTYPQNKWPSTPTTTTPTKPSTRRPRPTRKPRPQNQAQQGQNDRDKREIHLINNTMNKLNLTQELNDILLNLTTQYDTTNETHNRTKRWLFDAIGLAMDGVNMYLDHKSRKKVEKGIDLLKKRMGNMEGRMVNLENEMVSVAEAAFADINRIMDILGEVQGELQYIYWSLSELNNKIEVQGQRLGELTKAFILVTRLMTQVIDYQEREINLLMHLITELNHVLDALDTLSTGYLSHSVIPPYMLAQMIREVRETLILSYPEFELVLNQVHQYYNIPIGSFTYSDGILAIQVPLLVKPKLQEPLMMYQLRTVPVPYHMDIDMVSEKENRFAYTWLKMQKPLLAMSEDTYIDLTDQALKNCLYIGKTYYCQDVFLMRHKNFHTCGSAIYFRRNIDEIRELCDFEYYPHLVPEPELLDEGNRLLLTGLPNGWTYYCSHDEQIPTPVDSGSYVIVEKTDLCRCSISAGPWYIQENMAFCAEDLDTKFSFIIQLIWQ